MTKSTKPKTIRMTFSGLDSYIVLHPTGRRMLVHTGDTIEVLANEAASLKGSADWSAAPAITPTPKADPADHTEVPS